MEEKLIAQLKGDFGNPSGTGLARMEFFKIPETDKGTALTNLSNFMTAITSGTDKFSLCNVGDLTMQFKSPQYVEKPGVDANVDSMALVTWRQKSNSATRHMTIPGAAPNGLWEKKDGGWRLTESAKVALAAMISTLYGYTGADAAIVIQGVLVIKR